MCFQRVTAILNCDVLRAGVICRTLPGKGIGGKRRFEEGVAPSRAYEAAGRMDLQERGGVHRIKL